MRKFLLLASLILCVSEVSHSFPMWGFQLGFNINDYRYMISGDKQDRLYLGGLNFGLIYRTNGNKWRVQPTLLYSQKGAQNTDVPLDYSWYNNRLSYLSLSAPILYNVNMDVKNFTFSIGAGPYVAALLSAKATKVLLHGGAKEYEDFKIGSGEKDDFKRADFGLAFVMGAKLRRVNLAIGYDYGLANVSPNPNTSIKNRTFSINLGIFLNKYEKKRK